jgi:hypothetical protein
MRCSAACHPGHVANLDEEGTHENQEGTGIQNEILNTCLADLEQIANVADKALLL